MSVLTKEQIKNLNDQLRGYHHSVCGLRIDDARGLLDTITALQARCEGLEKALRRVREIVRGGALTDSDVQTAFNIADAALAEPAATTPIQPKYPHPCGLCPGTIESAEDTEWHGLGNCVPICERCTGSGIEPGDVTTSGRD